MRLSQSRNGCATRSASHDHAPGALPGGWRLLGSDPCVVRPCRFRNSHIRFDVATQNGITWPDDVNHAVDSEGLTTHRLHDLQLFAVRGLEPSNSSKAVIAAGARSMRDDPEPRTLRRRRFHHRVSIPTDASRRPAGWCKPSRAGAYRTRLRWPAREVRRRCRGYPSWETERMDQLIRSQPLATHRLIRSPKPAEAAYSPISCSTEPSGQPGLG